MNAPGWLTLAAVVIATAAIGFAVHRAVRGGLPAFPAALFAVVAADLTVIALAVASAQQLGYWNPDGAVWAKAGVIAAVTLLVSIAPGSPVRREEICAPETYQDLIRTPRIQERLLAVGPAHRSGTW